jgi:C4-dicarboxylate-specific signal transduction histidine kinase
MINGLFTQIIVAVVAVAIMITYVRPNLTRIGEIQTNIAKYEEEQTKVDAVNSQLRSLVSRVDSIPTDDNLALLAFMPDAVDNISVPRDINAIAALAGVELDQVIFKSEMDDIFLDENGQQLPNSPNAHSFTVSFNSSYEDFKNFLSLLQRNHYPLEVYDLKIDPSDESQGLDIEMNLVTYSFKKAPSNTNQP